jgi:hypothetical protein
MRQVVVTNDWKMPLLWHFEMSSVDTSVFKVDIVEGTIAAAELKTIHISFTPKAAIPYNFHLPVYAKMTRTII